MEVHDLSQLLRTSLQEALTFFISLSMLFGIKMFVHIQYRSLKLGVITWRFGMRGAQSHSSPCTHYDMPPIQVTEEGSCIHLVGNTLHLSTRHLPDTRRLLGPWKRLLGPWNVDSMAPINRGLHPSIWLCHGERGSCYSPPYIGMAPASLPCPLLRMGPSTMVTRTLA